MELNTIVRDSKQNPKGLLKRGLIPAVLYGRQINNLHLAVSKKEFDKVYKEAGESAVINLLVGGDNKKEKRPVLIYAVQHNPLTQEPIHIDFYQVRLDEKIKTHIPLVFVGEAPAVKSMAGVLVKNMSEIEVEALPADLPHDLRVDISKLENFETNIYVKDLTIPAGVKILISPETVVASVIPPREEEKLGVGKEEAEEAIAEVKVESEEKKRIRELERQEEGRAKED